MKKVIGIFLMMVFVVLVTSMALGEKMIVDNNDLSEVCTMVHDWARGQGLYEKYDWKLESGIYHAMGAISEAGFKEISGMDFSIENLAKLYYDCGNYGYDWDIYDCNIKTTGFIEGYNVYVMDMRTNKVPLGNAYNDITCEEQDYYRVSILFMVGK